jgi:hypothetical protein
MVKPSEGGFRAYDPAFRMIVLMRASHEHE